MKILKLKVKNITSFKGTHEIDFEDSLGGDDLFAITGPTGAGKSSILAAITLALYGCNYKRNINAPDLVSLGTDEGAVELEFALGGATYTASWRCKVLKKDGTPIKNVVPQRFLSQQGVVLDKGAEDIIQLSFDQFCRTVILNQGDFSRFIQSSFKDRKDILERLYNGEDLSLLGRTLKSLIKKAQTTEEHLNVRISSALPYNEEEIISFQQRVMEIEVVLERELPLQACLQKILPSLKDLKNLQKQKFDTLKKIADLQLKMNEAVNHKNRSQKTLESATLELEQKELILKENLPRLEAAILHWDKLGNLTEVQKKNISNSEKSFETVAKNETILADMRREILLLESTMRQKKQELPPCMRDARQMEELEKRMNGMRELAQQLQLIESEGKRGNELQEQLLRLQTELVAAQDELKTANERVTVLFQERSGTEALIKELEEAEVKKREAQAIGLCRELADSSGTCPVCERGMDGLSKGHPDQSKTDLKALTAYKKGLLEIERGLAGGQEKIKAFTKNIVRIDEAIQAARLKIRDLEQLQLKIKDAESHLHLELQSILHLLQYAYMPPEMAMKRFEEDRKKNNDLLQTEVHFGGKVEKLQLIEKNLEASRQDFLHNQKEVEETEIKLGMLKHEQLILSGGKDARLELQTLKETIEKERNKRDEKWREYHQKANEEAQWSVGLKTLNDQTAEIDMTSLPLLIQLQMNVGEFSSDTSAILGESMEVWRKALAKIEGINDVRELHHHHHELTYLHDEVLAKALETMEKTVAPLREELVEKKLKLTAQAKRSGEQAQARRELDALKEKLGRLLNLNELMGKDEFRIFALGLIEEKLIQLANHELASLCDGRYELVQSEGTYGPDFFVIDHSSGALTRKISTLSGGETFLVSLSMALGLAEMTRGKAEIDSFFIDEGFGSLDEDAIDDVLQVLMNLRNRGKQIGIISHIKTLTDRIPFNFFLNRSELGETRVQTLYN